MPDRQRHSRLSDVFAGLFAARSRKAPAPAGRRRGAVSPGAADSVGSTDFAGSAVSSGWPGWPEPTGSGEAGAAAPSPTEFGGADEDRGVPGYRNLGDEPRPAWQLSAQRNHQPDRPDPMADTMKLSRVPAQPTAERPDLSSGPDIVLPADADADVDAAAAAAIAAAGTATTATVTEAATDATGAVIGAVAGEGAGTGTGTGTEPIWSWQYARELLERHRRRFAMGAAGVVALAALLALPPVRAQLRDSFTQVPKPYTALYFTSSPQVNGTVLTVPVSVQAVDTGARTFSVRVWTVDAKGTVTESKNADLTGAGQTMSAVVSMPVDPTAAYVWVSLGGSTETLHYKIAAV